MGETFENKPKKHICLGILAHVDAGKTTLSESILYLTGRIRSLGRVDHKNTFFDTDTQERSRGITIFSKQAEFPLGDWNVTLLDTPGHVDFSAEMERTLQVLDYAILVINGADGVQSHTMTLWKLLKYYQIPVFLFVNKMDQNGTDRDFLLRDLQSRLDERCVDFGREGNEEFFDQLAMCNETMMEEFLERGTISQDSIGEAVAGRQVFPCYFGSALKVTGVEEFLDGIRRYGCPPRYPDAFSARIYKITRDAQGNRLTHMKITGGSLKVKTLLTNQTPDNAIPEDQVWQEKADQIRIYNGSQFQLADTAFAGAVCTVTGLTKTRAGDGLGQETTAELPILEPVLGYQILLPDGCDAHTMLGKLRLLEEEEPHLHIVWDEASGEIHAQLMGEVEIEVLRNLILDRFGLEVEFGSGSIVYKETIASAVEGVGHFEPLRHYAEVHLLLEPGEPGSGLQFESRCSEDMLARNWQRLVLTHLEEKKHRGVLTGSEITDMKITLIAGRAHQKHTEGGDFRQATYRAVRQGLKKAVSVLLEPVYEFQLELPAESVGRAMSDIQRMSGSFELPETQGNTVTIRGTAPVSEMREYQTEVVAYTRGLGRLFCTLKGYAPCHNAEEVIAAIGYDSESDLENPTGSVFCTHGAGFVVEWQDVEAYMHVESGLRPDDLLSGYGDGGASDGGFGSGFGGGAAAGNPGGTLSGKTAQPIRPRQYASSASEGYADEAELEAIFARTYGPVKREKNRFKRTIAPAADSSYRGKPLPPKSREQYLLVDGYNIIFAWKELKELAQINMDSARDKLMDLLCDYQGYKNMHLILVFDAYKVSGGQGSVQAYHNIHVIYTKEAETADQYIEKTVHEIGHKYDVTVATSDSLEQMIIYGSGARRLSAQGLWDEVNTARKELRETYLNQPVPGQKHLPFQGLSLEPEDSGE